jgi:hypothetical protein
MELVGSRTAHSVQHRTRIAPILRSVGAGHQAVFGDGILPKGLAAHAAGGDIKRRIVCVLTVEQKVIAGRTNAIHRVFRDASPGSERIGAGSGHRGDAWLQQSELRVVSAVEREDADLATAHKTADRG